MNINTKNRGDIIVIIERSRKEAKISLDDFCKRCDIDRVTYWRYRSGDCEMPFKDILKCLETLGIDLYIFRDVITS
jgi:transcriptional regulator with XRE-family HTH domain